MTRTDTERRLVNWGRAMAVHPVRNCCRSFEGRFRSPQRNLWEIPVPAFSEAIDMLDAWEVEHAVITLPRPRAVLLRSHYVFRAHPVIARRLVRRSGQRRFGDFGYELMLAHAALELALAMTIEQNRNTVRKKARQAIDFAAYAS